MTGPLAGLHVVELTNEISGPYATKLFVDLGADGYARALRGEFDPLPAFVGAPTYQTADRELEWLNRAQCLCVGRVDMKALRVEYDVYLIEVGGRKHSPT